MHVNRIRVGARTWYAARAGTRCPVRTRLPSPDKRPAGPSTRCVVQAAGPLHAALACGLATGSLAK